MHPDYNDPARRASLYRLFDRTWPGVVDKIALATRLGWCWDECTRPFARFDGDVALAHVGVLDLDVLLADKAQRIAGIHAVCTDPDHRRKGHYRAVMEAALAYVDGRYETAKLSTTQPELYDSFGFRVVPQNRFRVDVGGDGGDARPARIERVHELLSRRRPTSRVFAARDRGWLFGIDEVLWSGGLGHLWQVDEVVAAWATEGTTLHVYDILAAELPPLEDLLARAPWTFREAVLWFTPDLVAPNADPIAWPEDDYLMVRGSWPIEVPHAVPPHAGH
jgi:GNAT superfamily N-acetyltransferase